MLFIHILCLYIYIYMYIWSNKVPVWSISCPETVKQSQTQKVSRNGPGIIGNCWYTIPEYLEPVFIAVFYTHLTLPPNS